MRSAHLSAFDTEDTADTRVLSRADATPLSVRTLPDALPPFDTADLTPRVAPLGHATATVATRSDAMRHEEAGRIFVFSCFMIGLALVTLALVPLLGGHPLARNIFYASVALTLLRYIHLVWAAHNPGTFRPSVIAQTFAVEGLAAMGAAYYFGVFSPFIAICALALYVFSLGSSRRYAIYAYVNLSIGQGLLTALIISGTIVDRGLIRADALAVHQQVGVHLCVQMVFVLALLLGRMGRRRTCKAVHDLESAVRELARREALLHEAQLALARAEKDGPGRFTDHVLGSYKLGMVIGRGAMGEIYDACHVNTGAPAAVKLLHDQALGERRNFRRFVREARLAASLSAPNLVKVIEVPDADSSLPYLAMERLVGQDLWHLLRERHTLSLAEVLDMVEQVSAGLRVARAAGIVHRDLKPQNLFLAREDDGQRVWKLLDFGVSKLLSDEQASLTEGHVVGTPAYMAPEQANGTSVDHRADLYSLAVIVYRCLTGRPAYSGGRIPQILYDVVHKMPIQPSTFADVPEQLDAALAVALAKRPDDRFDSVDEFVDHLAAATRGELDESVVRRATALLARQPWGSHGVRSRL